MRKKTHRTLATFDVLRSDFLAALGQNLVGYRPGSEVPNFADAGTNRSVLVAKKMVEILGYRPIPREGTVQGIGTGFANHVKEYLEKAFSFLQRVRPGSWVFSTSQGGMGIAEFDQYEHLAELERILDSEMGRETNLRATLGSAYLITPDVTVYRQALSDDEFGGSEKLFSDGGRAAHRSPLRAANYQHPIKLLHASISCKWTMRTDRAQNARTEALNLIRNRKGHAPHIALVTFEPTPNIIASLALGTGDLDCVYHVALPELITAVAEVGSEDANELLHSLVEGKRLRDLSDLPLDLAL